MTRVLIFRRSDLPEVGPAAHLPASGYGQEFRAPTVVRTACGRVGIGRSYDRDGPTCPECQAVTGQHPGKRGKAYLRRLTEAGR
jgi:hypothetical protein